MKRRAIVIAGVAPWLATRLSRAQVPARQFRIGFLSPIAYETWSLRPIFVEAMRERGLIEGTPSDDLPVELPTHLYLTLNLKAARAIGITLPQSLLLRADEVLQ